MVIISELRYHLRSNNNLPDGVPNQFIEITSCVPRSILAKNFCRKLCTINSSLSSLTFN